MTHDNHDSAAQLRANYHKLAEAHNNAARALLLDFANNLAHVTERAIARVEALEAELAEARAEIAEANDHKPDTLNAAAIVYDLEARGLWTVKPDDVPTRDYAKDALRTVLDGVDAVFGRVADVGGPVEVPGPVPDEDGWYMCDDSLPIIKKGEHIDADWTDSDGRWAPLFRDERADHVAWHYVVRWRYADVRDVRGGGE